MCQKILVVDDNKNNVRLLKDILEDENYNVSSVDNGLDVFETVLKVKPDAILLDIMMPGMDGFGVCKILHDNSETKDIPVIMVTAKTESESLKSALESGAIDYIKKPIDEVEVIARVQSALRLKQHQDKLAEMASKDGLTGLFNHNVLIELLKKELHNQERNGSNISFVMIDIDHFKNINDNYGHTAGDMVLKELSKILLSTSRSGDIIGRYGGEEFGIVLSETSSESGFSICKRFRKNVESHEFNFEGQKIKITVSLGICNKSSQNKIGSRELITKADEALYQAKRNGRNRIEIVST